MWLLSSSPVSSNLRSMMEKRLFLSAVNMCLCQGATSIFFSLASRARLTPSRYKLEWSFHCRQSPTESFSWRNPVANSTVVFAVGWWADERMPFAKAELASLILFSTKS